MNDEILDHEEAISSNKYYLKSVNNLKISAGVLLLGIGLLITSVSTNFQVETLSMISALLLLTAAILGFSGVINGIRSYLNKEDDLTYRAAVLLCNFAISSIFIWLFISVLLDLKRIMSW